MKQKPRRIRSDAAVKGQLHTPLSVKAYLKHHQPKGYENTAYQTLISLPEVMR